MTDRVVPPAPVRDDPEQFPEDRRELYKGIHDALAALPIYFDFDNPISGIDATDFHAINTLMGAAIEVQVVQTLNSLRSVWDPNRQWADYSFQRSSQAFPDVRLTKRTDAGLDVIFGIELKGWFLLAKEGVPSLRFQVSPDACNPWDLVCVVPWYLSNAVAGKPEVGLPWVEQARYAARWRDHWWEYIRGAKSPEDQRGVIAPDSASPYPHKADLVSMKPISDGGGNYGRLPRCKPLMDVFVEEALAHPILGIPALDWQTFLKIHSENADSEEVLKRVIALNKTTGADSDLRVERLRALLREIATDFDFS